MSGRLDRNALRADVAEVKRAWDAMSSLARTVSQYVSALDEIDLSSVPVQGAKLDLFYKVPTLRPVLVAARDHARKWNGIGTELVLHTLLDVHVFGANLTTATNDITATVKTATTAKRALTATERTSILSALQGLRGALEKSATEMTGRRQPAVDFVRQLVDDTQPLQHGSEDLGRAIAAIQETTTNEALKYMQWIGIYKLIIDWGSKVLARLRALQATLQPLSGASARSQHAIQQMLTIWETVKEKFATVIDVLATTEASVDDFSLLPDLLEVAAASWSDVTDYVRP